MTDGRPFWDCGGGADLRVNHKGSTPLHLSARHGHRTCCERLVAAPVALGTVGAANDMGRTAVHLAAWQGHHEAM